VKITFDPIKRDMTFKERGLEFEKAGIVFAGRTYDKKMTGSIMERYV